MHSKLLLSFVFSLSLLVTNGSETMKNMDHSKMDHSKMTHQKNDSSRKRLSAEDKKSVLDMLKANEALLNSFFKYEGEKVEKASAKLAKSIEGIKNSEISKLLEFSKSKLEEIKASNNRKDNNQSYHLVSMALIHILKSYDTGDDYNAYSCPMVKKKWIQNSKKLAKVHNPYAPQMLHCGSQDSKYQ